MKEAHYSVKHAKKCLKIAMNVTKLDALVKLNAIQINLELLMKLNVCNFAKYTKQVYFKSIN